MRLHTALLRGFYLSPSGKAAEAVDTEDGELTDDEVLAADDSEGEEAPVDDGAPEPEAEAEPEVVSYKDYFAKAGLNDIPDDPAQFASRFQQLTQAQHEAANQRQMIQMLQWQLQQNAQPKPEPQKAAERKKLFEIPQFDPALKAGLMVDENGAIVAKPGYDPSLPQQYQKYQAAIEQYTPQALQMLADPHSFVEQHIQPALAPFIQQQAMEIAQQQFAHMQEQAALQQFTAQNREWAFDAAGNLTQLGHMWNQHYFAAKQHGIPDAIGYAETQMKAMERDYLLSQQQQESPEATDAKKKVDFLKAAAKRTANKGGSFPTRHKEGPPQNKKDPWSKLRQDLKQLPENDFE